AARRALEQSGRFLETFNGGGEGGERFCCRLPNVGLEVLDGLLGELLGGALDLVLQRRPRSARRGAKAEDVLLQLAGLRFDTFDEAAEVLAHVDVVVRRRALQGRGPETPSTRAEHAAPGGLRLFLEAPATPPHLP